MAGLHNTELPFGARGESESLMKRLTSEYIQAPPPRRPLKIFASDPMLGRTLGNRVTIEIANEKLEIGPQGSRVEVIDYDGAHDRYYAPVNLNDPAILMQGGLEPAESDPRFHQQMVYAVTMKVLENFDRALGRRLEFGGRRLKLLPHAFHGANAFYDPTRRAVLFGYFRADRDDPGGNLPGQNVFTCLSHDIIAHEVTHALVDRLRSFFIEPTNIDVMAFHEGFADIVALFQHFTFHELLRDVIQRSRTNLRSRTQLVELARQFGHATGSGQALRSALDVPDRKLYDSMLEPHQRGSILVAAVFDAFFKVYQGRIRDLLRIATGGTGTLAEGDLHPDLVQRVASEATQTAQNVLTMCIRAFEYLPTVDVTFGDYLRALVTADYELVPTDQFGQRAAMIEAFRLRGIYPTGVASLAEESLVWAEAEGLPDFPATLLPHLAVGAKEFSRTRQGRYSPEQSPDEGDAEIPDPSSRIDSTVAAQLLEYAQQNAAQLGLDPSPNRTIAVKGFHPSFRVGPTGQLLIELVAQLTQSDDTYTAELGGLPLRGGTTVVVAADGRVRYVIAKPLPSTSLLPEQKQAAEERLERQRAFIRLCDANDPRLTWSCKTDNYEASRMAARKSFKALDQGVF
jgi:hypothetical protein